MTSGVSTTAAISVGDTVLDPFVGTGSTMIAAAKWGRNSIGVEVSREYSEMARRRFEKEAGSLFGTATFRFDEPVAA
jgi:DNA modification methylase